MRLYLVIIAATLLSSSGSAAAQQAGPASAPRTQPPSLSSHQPITASFRRLLAASEEEQQTILTQQSPQTREVFRSKLNEYRALPASERDYRLRVLDLRWYFNRLRDRAPVERSAFLGSISPADRQLVEERLTIWDALSAEHKQAVLRHDIARAYLVAPPLPPSPPPLQPTPPSPWQLRIEQAAKSYRALPMDLDIAKNFQRIAEEPPLPPGFSEAERKQRMQTFQALMQLAPTEREKCVVGFGRFVAMPKAEREQFMQKASLWKKLSRAEQDTLTALTEHLPPSPPGLHSPPPPPLSTTR